MVSLVTTPKAPVARVRRLELVALQDFLVLLVLVLQEARVLQFLLHSDEVYTQETLSAPARRLNEMFAGLSAPEILARLGTMGTTPFEEQVATTVHRLVQEEDAQK